MSMRYIFVFWIGFLGSFCVFAATPTTKILQQADALIQDQIRLDTQKQRSPLRSLLDDPEIRGYDARRIDVQSDTNETGCVRIESIAVHGVSLLDAQTLQTLKQPYLHHCHGMKNLMNLVHKITNAYIDRGYVTSRAYLRPQDLQDGSVAIEVLEARIEKIEFVNTQPLEFMSIYEEQILNLRDLEVELQQRERLRSMAYAIELFPGTQQGYSIVRIVAKDEMEPLYGNLHSNNLGSKNTGKHQIGLNANYENLFGVSDLFGLHLNTTHKNFQSHNYSKGMNVDYSFVVRRFVFAMEYGYSKFDILSKDEFSSDVITFGNTKKLGLKTHYKLYHGPHHSLELHGGYNQIKTHNYLSIFLEQDNGEFLRNTTALTQQSYTLGNIFASISHSYRDESITYDANFDVIGGLDAWSKKSAQAPQKADFIKYQLLVNFSKRFALEYEPTYNCALNGQIVNKDVFAIDEISMGGPYSVRGFSDVGLSGEKGFFIRNDLAINTTVETVRISPYVGLDYGYIAHFGDISQRASILGSAFGFKTAYKQGSLDLFFHRPIHEDAAIKHQNSSFIGFTFNLNF